MKNDKQLDNLFKEGASGFSIEPSVGLFDTVEAAHISAKRRKKRVFYLWTLAALLLLIGGVASWIILSNTGIDSSEEINNKFPTNKIGKSNSNESKAIKLSEKQEMQAADEEVIMSKGEKANEDVEIQKAVSDLTLTKVEQAEFNQQNDNVVVFENVSILSQSNFDDVEIKNKVGDEVVLETMVSRNIYEIAMMQPEIIDPRKVTGMEKYLKKRKKLHFYTGFSAKVAMVYYPDTDDQLSYSADINLGLRVKKFYVESGVGYQNMKERGQYQIAFKSNDSIGYFNEVISFEIDPQNPDEINYKTEQTTVYDSVEHYKHSTPLFSYSYINIPLKVGYCFYNKEKLSLSAETGLIYSIMVAKDIPEVSMSNPEYELLSITNNTPVRVESNFQWQLALRLDYRFAKSVSVSAQPVFTKYINSIYDINAGYPDVKPYTMGLRFGLYFDF